MATSNYFNPLPKVYRAQITQSGAGAPSVTILENSIGAIIWSRSAIGSYLASLANGFPLLKCAAQITASGSAAGFAEFSIPNVDSSFLTLFSYNVAGVLTDGILGGTVEIYVYP